MLSIARAGSIKRPLRMMICGIERIPGGLVVAGSKLTAKARGDKSHDIARPNAEWRGPFARLTMADNG
jgi:hypothetical protein